MVAGPSIPKSLVDDDVNRKFVSKFYAAFMVIRTGFFVRLA
jgi:hypothetical protein